MKNLQQQSDRGEITSQTVIVLPLAIFVLFVAIQSALYFHTSHAAGAAAAEGASAASAKSLNSVQASQRGQERANALLQEIGTELAAMTRVEVLSHEVQVTVVARVPRVAPFFPPTVSRTVVEPRERFLAEIQR